MDIDIPRSNGRFDTRSLPLFPNSSRTDSRWYLAERRQFSCQGVAEPRSGVPGRAAGQASCRWIGRENATPVPTIPRVVTKSSPSSNIPITWALTRSKVRTKPSSNVDRRVHARASLVRTDREFERFDHVGSQEKVSSNLLRGLRPFEIPPRPIETRTKPKAPPRSPA